MDPLKLEVHCPLFAQPEEANLPTVQRIFADLPVKSERVFYLPESLNPSDAFEIAKTAVSERDVRFVGTFISNVTENDRFDQSAWYYGMTKVERKRYVLTATVSEIERIIRISTACDDEVGCTGFLSRDRGAIRRALVCTGGGRF